ncbi:carboxypeptidase-like regulatory domain-containing protein [Baekduia sp. Peel2402]|uniref:carboxypeptidase-like regulatory domain-containing protein n=1 Tax=Baekduia sp. Peel2402 TaxID=3458296 RepID=UPI00403EA862
MSRFKTLIAVAVTLLLLALLAGMALAAGEAPAPAPYGYAPGDPCSFSVCRFVASGRVTDAASGAPLADAKVTLQQRTGDGAWGPAGDVRPTGNPLTTEATGRFTWLVRGGTADQVRVVVVRDGYVSATSAARALRADGALDVALSPVPVPAPVVVEDPAPAPPPLPGTPAPPVGGAGTPVAPATPAAVKGCASKKGTAKAACLRAEKLAKALKACRTQKGSKRTTCEKRARALSACDAKTGEKRSACRKKALAIGQKPIKATKKSHRR